MSRVHTPTVLQMEAVECGAACLAMILGYHGRIVPLEELREACGVSRDGSNAKNMVDAAALFGLEATGYKKEPEDLRLMDLPVIVFWEFNHFVVVEGITKNKVYLNDPAMGPRIVTREEFDESFTGIVLAFAPGDNFKKAGSHPQLLPEIRQRLHGSGPAVCYVILASFLLVIPGLLVPMFSRIFVDDYLIKNLEDWFKPLITAMILTTALTGALSWLQQYFLLRLQTKLAIATSGKFLWHVLRLPMRFYLQRYSGDISSRVQYNDDVAVLLSGRLATAAVDSLMVVFYAALMACYDLTLTLICIAAVALNVLATKMVNRRRVNINRRLLQEDGKLMGIAMSGLDTIESLKASGVENDFFSRWAGYQAKLLNAQQELGLTSRIFLQIPPLLTGLAGVLILVVGGFHVMEGLLSMGELIAFQSLMMLFLGPVNNFVNLAGLLQETQGKITRLNDITRNPLDAQIPTEIGGEANSAKKEGLRKLEGYVELRGITFGFSPMAPPLIENFNLAVKPGARVALVGRTGSGKSTLGKIIAGLYEPWSGQILLDGKLRKDIPREEITNSIAMVDQDIVLFDGSLRANITLWDQTAPQSDMVTAAKDATIHGDITQRQGGYDGLLSHDGANFSGGQRQRIEIARALAVNPRILILDEATSALDTITEYQIDRNLRRRGCTCIIVSHRLSTIRDCDEIIVLDAGKVVQRGTHEQLKQDSGGLYARLIKL